jgi:2-pyrone-4,6-dicarboxylate lactonase
LNAGRLPRRATNAHCHVFGPRERFAFADDAPYAPAADAPKEALFALNDRLGLERCVVVQSQVHGFDNRATEDAIAARPGRYRGIALLRTDVSNAELRRLDRAGFRGVRFNYGPAFGTPAPIDDVLALAERLEPLQWHLQIQCEPQWLAEFGPALKRSPVPLVIDHIGRIDASLGLQQPHFDALCALLGDERFWVKVSGIDRITRQGPPYGDALPFAAHLVAAFPDRVLWGNDWPHPQHTEPVPSDDALVDAIAQMAPSEAAREKLLVANPQRLYRFEDPVVRAGPGTST